MQRPPTVPGSRRRADPRDPLARAARRDRRRQGRGAAVPRAQAAVAARSRPPAGRPTGGSRSMMREENLNTVCEEANCPNVGECWERGTATFMILGDTCTRRCGFCNVQTGVPTWNDPLEPARVAQSVKQMGLTHAVITSVDRDDLPDYGASAFVGVIRSIRAPGARLQGRDPDPRLPRPGDAAGPGDRRAARRLQPQLRGRAAPLPDGPPRLASSCARRGCCGRRRRWAATR